MAELLLDQLPDLPQTPILVRVAQNLWRHDDVVAIWLGGSFASGGADAFSDVDLRIAVDRSAIDAWRQPDLEQLFEAPCPGHQAHAFADDAVLHHVLLADGCMFDLYVQSTDRDNLEQAVCVLGCRDEAFGQRLARFQRADRSPPQPADAETLRQLIIDFWISWHKHRKVLHRDLDVLAITGVQNDRTVLTRLWYVQLTGCDVEPGRPSIHAMTQLVRTIQQAKGAAALAILGAPLDSRAAIINGIEQVADEVGRAGRQLAPQLGFEYPHAVEQTARRCWTESLSSPSNRSDNKDRTP